MRVTPTCGHRRCRYHRTSGEISKRLFDAGFWDIIRRNWPVKSDA